MASFTWDGGAGDYLDPTQWTPSDVPLYGEDTVATITAGNVRLSGAEPNGIMLAFGGPTVPGQVNPFLTLSNAAFGPAMTVDISDQAILDVEGYDTNYGTIAIGPPGAPVTTARIASRGGFGQLNQEGALSVGPAASLIAETPTVINNDGRIDIVGGNASVGGAVTGTGTINVAAAGTVTLFAAVGPGQTIRLQQGALDVESPATFQATIAGFTDSGASLTFGHLAFDTATYAQDDAGERLILTNAGVVVGTVSLTDTPATQYDVTQSTYSTTISPAGPVYTDGSIPSTISAGVVTIRNAEPDGQTVVLGRLGNTVLNGDIPNLVLDNAALGPGLILAVGTPDADLRVATMTVRGDDAAYGQINVGTLADSSGIGGDGQLTINLTLGSRLNQEGTINVVQVQSRTALTQLQVQGPGTLSNDGQITVSAGAFFLDEGTGIFSNNGQITVSAGAEFLEDGNAGLTGSGTVKIDGGSVRLTYGARSAQTVDLLRGGLELSSGAFQGTIKDWSATGRVSERTDIGSVQFNQTSAEGGNLQVFSSNGTQISDLKLLGTYATPEFRIAHDYGSSTISLAPPS